MCAWLTLLLALAAEPQVHRDLPYVEPREERRTLDVYAPPEGKGMPVVIWVHGGGWRSGDKTRMDHKPRAFTERGYVFIAINHRFTPHVSIKEMAGDVAAAIRWAHDHAARYRGDPKRLIVMGHSSGAHLAALVCTDDRYLKAQGLPLSIIKACMPFDSALYDVTRQLKNVKAINDTRRIEIYRTLFGVDEPTQRDLSPITHIARDKSIPAFLILHADRADGKGQSHHFQTMLRASGIRAQVAGFEQKTHATLNTDFGVADDPVTKAVFDFLAALGPASAN